MSFQGNLLVLKKNGKHYSISYHKNKYTYKFHAFIAETFIRAHNNSEVANVDHL